MSLCLSVSLGSPRLLAVTSVSTQWVAVSLWVSFFFQAEDGIRDLVRSRGLGDVYKRQVPPHSLVLGLPAKIVREVSSDQAAMIRRIAQSYVQSSRAYLAGRSAPSSQVTLA